MSASRDEDLLRRGAVLLSALVLTKNEGLARFREHRVADKRVSDEQLAKARAVLDAVTYALLGDSRDNWKRIEEAHRILEPNEPPKERVASSQQAQAPTRSARMVEQAPGAAHEPWTASSTSDASGGAAATPTVAARPPAPERADTARREPGIFAHLSSPAPFVPPPKDDPAASLDETAALDPALFAHLEPATPFREGPAMPPATAVAHETGDLAGQTSFLDPAAIADVVAAYPLPTKLPMAVERYAALVARSGGLSDTELVTLHREYGVADSAHRKRIDQKLSDALSRDDALRKQFADCLRQWRDWLRGQRNE